MEFCLKCHLASLSAPLPPCDRCPITPVLAALATALSRPGNPQIPAHTYLNFLLLHSVLCLEKHSLITLSHNLVWSAHPWLFWTSILYQVCPFIWLILSHLSRCDSGFISSKPFPREYPDWSRCPSHSILYIFFWWTFWE